MQSSQDCSKSNGDQLQHVLLAAIWRLQHPHWRLQHPHCLSPGQGEAWKGINPALQGAPLRPTLRQRLASEREEEEKEDAEEEARKNGGSLADLHL